jgi:5-methyltetrahydrofolate--homocysteine methyltransferase
VFRNSAPFIFVVQIEQPAINIACRESAFPCDKEMKKPLIEAVLERRLVCDGAMGTQLMLAGLEQGGCGEHWNLTHSERVLAIQRRYADAGADCIITNTFGGSRIMLKRHGHAEDLRAINQAGARIAREAFGDRTGYVLGDLGPLGAILEPYGDLPAIEAEAAYEEQARALVEAGVDAIIIETQTSLEELGVAVDAAKNAGAPCVIASLAYDLSADKTFYVTMMGVMPDKAAEFLEQRGADIVALNCGTGMDMAGAAMVARIYRESSRLPTMVQPNAGLPVLENMKAVYKQLPPDMARGVPEVLEAGANIIGSCCGSTPDHTRAIREVVEKFNRSK